MYGLIQTGLGCTAAVVDGMDMREVNDLMGYWTDNPPAHVAVTQLRDVVLTAFGGKPPERRRAEVKGVSIGGQAATPEQFAAMLGVKLEAP